MSEQEIKLALQEKADEIAKTIHKGKDVEITKTANGVAFKEVSKKRMQ